MSNTTAYTRRSQRSNRRLPVKFLDESIEVSPVLSKKRCILEKEPEGKSPGASCKLNHFITQPESFSKPISVPVTTRVNNAKTKTDVAPKPNIKAVKSSPVSNESLQCKTCGYTFSRPSSLRRHAQAASCKEKSDQESDADEEMAGSEVPSEAGTTKKKRKVCPICCKSFVDKYTLLVHKRTHTGERPFHCTLCEKKFTQRSALQFHLDTHAGEKHECSICGYKFTQSRSLKRHMLFHTGNKEMKRKMVNRNYNKIRVLADPGEEESDDKGEQNVRTYTELFECHYCKKQFKRVSELTVHIRVHTNERPFACKTCGKSFKQLCHLNGHQATHHNSLSFVCGDCGRKFTMAKSLRRHQALKICADSSSIHGEIRKRARLRKNHQEESEPDVIWDTDNEDVFSIKAKRDDHSSASTSLESLRNGPEVHDTNNINNDDASKEVHTCEQCEISFNCMDDLMEHRASHSTEPQFSCSICTKTFRSMSHLKGHLKTHSDTKQYACEHCNKGFKTLRCLQNHTGRNSCTRVRPFTCEICGKTFMYSRYLKTHRCHNTPIKVYKCGDCGNTYGRKDRLIEHLRKHTGERPHVCGICGKTFAKIANFRLHQRVHTGEKKYECKRCSKRFAHNSTLKYHEGTHTEKNSFPCDECHKEFPRSKALQAHMQAAHGAEGGVQKMSYLCANCGKVYHHLKRLLKHFCEVNGVKQYKCGTCDKQFDRAKQLEIHMRVHTGEKPYECDKCGKRFSQSGGLKDHLLSHTREKKFKCDLCDVRFLRMKSLRKHKLIIHTGVEPHICGLCGATFKYFKALKKHELLHGPTMASEQKTLTDILVDIEQAINDASVEAKEADQTMMKVDRGIDPPNNVAEVVIQDDSGQEIIIGPHDGHVLHFFQDPHQVEIDQSIHEIQIQTHMEENQERPEDVLMAVMASVDHHEEVVSIP